jgi:hypothetical protein
MSRKSNTENSMTKTFDTVTKILNTSVHDGYDYQFDDAPSHKNCGHGEGPAEWQAASSYSLTS